MGTIEIIDLHADPLKRELWRCTGMRRLEVREGVIERLANPLFHKRLAIQRHGVTQIKLKQP